MQLARALADKYGQRFTAVANWRPLLEFTRGNPLTITVLAGQALREGLHSKEQIKALVEKLRQGKAEFQDEISQGRSQSLGASLSYGFKFAFSENEQRVLALLYLFQGFVQVGVLQTMGSAEADWSVPELHAYDHDKLVALLDRAAEVGLLTSGGGGYYFIHPALSWFFKGAVERCCGAELATDPLAPIRAFVEAMRDLGSHYFWEYGGGKRDVISVLQAEEANLLHARRLACAQAWWKPVTGTMQGLRTLYEHTGRRAEWRSLVEQIVPDFVDPTNNGPLPGREDNWSLVTEYRVRLAHAERDWPQARALQQVWVEWHRKRAETLVDRKPETLTDVERNTLRALGVSLHMLAQTQREQGLAECVDNYKEDLRLAQQFGDQQEAAICAYNLGNAYKNLSSIRDLKQAEHWYHQSLEMHDPQDRLGRARCLGQLGLVAWERFKEARSALASEDILLGHINMALSSHHQALDMVPNNAVNDLATVHHTLGAIYDGAGKIDKALEHYRESIRYQERQGDMYRAGVTRYNVTLAMTQAGRLADALEYARAALANFQHCGDRATDWVQKAQQLIAIIEKEIKG